MLDAWIGIHLRKLNRNYVWIRLDFFLEKDAGDKCTYEYVIYVIYIYILLFFAQGISSSILLWRFPISMQLTPSVDEGNHLEAALLRLTIQTKPQAQGRVFQEAEHRSSFYSEGFCHYFTNKQQTNLQRLLLWDTKMFWLSISALINHIKNNPRL